MSSVESERANDQVASLLPTALEKARSRLLLDQSTNGFWCYEFEADCTIPAEYVLLAHFCGEMEFLEFVPGLSSRLATYLRNRQDESGGWPLYWGGAMDISCSVKAYYALKLLGDDVSEPHMVRARDAILNVGGAIMANVFTRITLALFEQVPWKAVPVVPVELILFPRWAPVHISKVSYWSRTVTIPLAVLCSLKPKAVNPLRVGVEELFVRPPASEGQYFSAATPLAKVFLGLDRIAQHIEPVVPGALRRKALARCEQWIVERLNGVDGIGAIYPAMANAYCALGLLGYEKDHPVRQEAAESIKRLVVVQADEAYCQPCVSPIWDTGLACQALVDAGLDDAAVAEPGRRDESGDGPPSDAGRVGARQRIARVLEPVAGVPLDAPRLDEASLGGWLGTCPAGADEFALGEALSPGQRAVRDALDWTVSRQLTDEPGDWRDSRPTLAGGGWAFEFANPHYPDIDDTALLGWLMLRVAPNRYGAVVRRAADWVAGMQSSNGGFAAFDIDNTHYYLNEVPFADHGALLDPPTSDVTARCLAFLSLADPERYSREIAGAIEYLEAEQETEGPWYGRWGTNYIYGTWSVLSALEVVPAARRSHRNAKSIGRASEWLIDCQRSDGGWGETNDTYADRALMGQGERSTSFHTAWAILALIAAGCGDHDAVRRGVEHLFSTQRSEGHWYDPEFSCPGFPRVFYLKYHGYSKYFPLWALARYERHLRGLGPVGVTG